MNVCGLISHPAYLFSQKPLPPQIGSEQRDMQALQRLLCLQAPAPEQELNITV